MDPVALFGALELVLGNLLLLQLSQRLTDFEKQAGRLFGSASGVDFENTQIVERLDSGVQAVGEAALLDHVERQAGREPIVEHPPNQVEGGEIGMMLRDGSKADPDCGLRLVVTDKPKLRPRAAWWWNALRVRRATAQMREVLFGEPQHLVAPDVPRSDQHHVAGYVMALVMSPQLPFGHRSEERRVGKECRSRWSPYH